MLRLIALAFMPTVSVTFGILAVSILALPATTSNFSTGASVIYGAAALSVALSIPIALMVARQMLSRRERSLLNAGAGTAHAIPR